MSRPRMDLPLVYLKPGEMYFAVEPCIVVTVLGSCISVTMYSRSRGLGGICHGLLPVCTGQKECHGECAEGLKFVDCSIRRMVRIFDQHKVRRSEIVVKCFGGADMFTGPIRHDSAISIGQQNISIAEQVLHKEGLRPQAQDMGGQLGRKIFFYPHTGEVYLKRLRRATHRQAHRGQTGSPL